MVNVDMVFKNIFSWLTKRKFHGQQSLAERKSNVGLPRGTPPSTGREKTCN